MQQTTRAAVSQAEALTGQVHVTVALGVGGLAFCGTWCRTRQAGR